MADRPQWARNILSFLDHGILDDDYPEDDSADAVVEEIEQFAKDRLCQEFGHVIYDDQCNIPEHRFCGWCNRRETAINEQEKTDD